METATEPEGQAAPRVAPMGKTVPNFTRNGEVETLQDWWFIVEFATLKLIKKVVSIVLLFLLTFPIYTWDLDYCFQQNHMGLICNLGWAMETMDE